MIYNESIPFICVPFNGKKIALTSGIALLSLAVCIIGILALTASYTGNCFGLINRISWPTGLSLTLLGAIISTICLTFLVAACHLRKTTAVEEQISHNQKIPQDTSGQTIFISSNSMTQRLVSSKIGEQKNFLTTKSEALEKASAGITKAILFYTPNGIDHDFPFTKEDSLSTGDDQFSPIFNTYQSSLGDNLMLIIDNKSFAPHQWNQGLGSLKTNFRTSFAKSILAKADSGRVLFTSEKDWSKKLEAFLQE